MKIVCVFELKILMKEGKDEEIPDSKGHDRCPNLRQKRLVYYRSERYQQQGQLKSFLLKYRCQMHRQDGVTIRKPRIVIPVANLIKGLDYQSVKEEWEYLLITDRRRRLMGKGIDSR